MYCTCMGDVEKLQFLQEKHSRGGILFVSFFVSFFLSFFLPLTSSVSLSLSLSLPLSCSFRAYGDRITQTCVFPQLFFSTNT